LQIKSAYLQMLVKDRNVSLRKILGTENIADVFTKPLGSKVLSGLLKSSWWHLDTSTHIQCREHDIESVQRVLVIDDKESVSFVL
jgi:hypothetical protein